MQPPLLHGLGLGQLVGWSASSRSDLCEAKYTCYNIRLTPDIQESDLARENHPNAYNNPGSGGS